MSAPLPTDVTPRINPSTAPMSTAETFARVVRSTVWRSRATSLGMNSARPRIVTATMMSATAIDTSSVGSKLLP